jgi:hypothetical protein
MRKYQSEYVFDDISNLTPIQLDESELTIMQEKIAYRRKRVNQLRLSGYLNKEIAKKIGCKLSTIEKDNHVIRESSRQWFENDAITEYCESIHNEIILYDCGIEELRLICKQETSFENKIKIWSKIIEFESKKTILFEKTKAVRKYLE